ncbi:MAG: ATP-binding protein [Patescibacteria group bacterium]|nr:ATP-binding protein [Patescibacteria group bacterium]
MRRKTAKEPEKNIFSKLGLKLIIPFFAISFIALLLIGGLFYFQYQAQISFVQKIEQNISSPAAARGLLAELPAQELARDRQIFYLAGGSAIFILLLFIGLIIFLIYRQLLRPLRSFEQKIAEMKKGGLDNKIKLAATDELGYLADIFKQINGHLQETYVRAEETIKKRTKDADRMVAVLQKKNLKMKDKEATLANRLEDAFLLEKELKEGRDRVSAIIACMGEGLIVTDKAGKIISLNPAAEWMLKITANKVAGQNLDAVAPLFIGKECEKRVPFVDYPTIKAIRFRKILIFNLTDDYYFLSKSGAKMAVILSSSPLLKEGRVFGAVTIFRNMSAEKRLDDAKNNFISIASHQLRTPLTSMRWFSEMLISGDAGVINKKQTKFVERIYQGTERMIRLVNLLLQIARVEAGRVKIEPIPIDFKNTIQGVEITLKTLLEEKSQRLKMIFKPDPFPSVYMDQEVIWQVFQNLLSNASRYASRRSTITVTAEKKGELAEFSIADKGIDIPHDAQDRIFHKFFRAENAIKIVPEGSGLGLSLVKSLVEGWGGKIWFKSQKGKGTTFYFTVPLSGMKPKRGDVGLAI